jgi:hypothetical protein
MTKKKTTILKKYYDLKLSSKQEREIAAYLARELSKINEERQPLLEKWRKGRNQYQGKRKSKDFPWRGVPNRGMPITRSFTNTVFATIMTALLQFFPSLIICKATTDDEKYHKIAKKLQEKLNEWFRVKSDFFQKIKHSIKECVKNGTGSGKVLYEKDERWVFTKEGSKKPQMKLVTVSKGVNFYPIPIENVRISSDAISITDIDKARLIAIDTWITPEEAKLRAKQGIYYEDKVDFLLQQEPDEESEEAKERAEKEGRELQSSYRYKISECWFYYDINDDGIAEDIVVSFHESSNTILRAIFNPLFYSYRPIVFFTYDFNEFTIYADGVAQILEQIQDEIDEIHNMRRLNNILANITAFKIRRGTREEFPDIYPGVQLWVDEPDDITTMQMGIPVQYDIREEQQDNLYAEQAVGISSYNLGRFSGIVSREPAKAVLALMEEVNKKFQLNIIDIKHAIKELAYKITMLYLQHEPEFFNVDLSVEEVKEKIHIEIAVSSVLFNETVQREIYLTMYQLILDFYDKISTIAQVLSNPQVPIEYKETLFSMIRSAEEMMTKILQTFDINAEKYIPKISEVYGEKLSRERTLGGIQPISPEQSMGYSPTETEELEGSPEE